MNEIHVKDFNLIEDFILGNLSLEEEENFRERLKTDAKFAKTYHFRTQIEKYWNESDLYDKTKKRVNEVLKEEQSVKRKSFSSLYYIAASIVILIGVIIFYRQQINHGGPDHELTRSEQDTSTNQIQPLLKNVQPEKGTQYIVPPEFTTQDTLNIQRPKDLKGVNRVQIKNSEDDIVVAEYEFKPRQDSLLIPLKSIMPGNYQWIIVGTTYSGYFKVKESPE